MDFEIGKYVKKQNELQEKIKELFTENKILKYKMSVLSECLSLEKVKRKIFELEDKQNMLKSLESMINKLKTDIKPLEYLKRTLEQKFMANIAYNNESIIVEQKDLESSDFTVNSGCAIETLDSLSDVSSEESIIVLSEYDVLSDEEINTTETTVHNKVLYAEALQMAASVHLSLADSLTSNIGSIGLLPNEIDQIKEVDHCIQSESKDVALMNASSKSEQLLELYDVVNKQDILNCKENDKIKCDTGETTTHKNHQLCVFDKLFDAGKRKLDNEKYENVPKCINNDSWVKFNTNELPEILIKNEPFVEKCQAVAAESQKENIIPKVNMSSDICTQYDKLSNYQLESKDVSEIKSFENVCNNIDKNDKNEIHKPVSSINILKDNIGIKSSLLNTDDILVSRECNNISTDINAKPSSINDDKKSGCDMNEFNIMSLNVELLNGIHQHGIQDLTNLQLKCIYYCINRRDIICYSYPCIGKSTMCFISLLQMIDVNLNECQAIVLVPTLDLAWSAQKTIKSLGKFLNVSTFISGFDVPHKISPVPHIVISTPRDLYDMINCSSLYKDFIKTLVIDDTDEMFDCNGFFNQIRHILLFLNNDRQLIVLSTSKLEEILDQFSDIMRNPKYIIVPDEKPFLNDIIQYYVNVSEEWKFDAICELYEIFKSTQTVVYCHSWYRSLEIAENMRLKTYTVSVVHNDMDISQRRLILRQFRSGNSRMLVTTGLLRGENFSDIVLVINYDLPKSPKDYVRKIVSCFSSKVKVINFITKNDITAKDIIETAFNIHMLYLPQDLTNLFVSNLDSNNDQILSLLEL